MSEGSFCQGQLQDYFVKLKFPTAELMISSCDQAFKFPVRLIESSSAPTIHCHHFKLTPCLPPPPFQVRVRAGLDRILSEVNLSNMQMFR